MNGNGNDSDKMNKLITFVEEYAFDYQGTGKKESILENLKNKDLNLAIEILNSMDKGWIDRTKELQYFLVFDEYEEKDQNGEKITKPFYRTDYIDSLEFNERHIPTLRYVKPRVLNKSLDMPDERE